MAHPPEVTGLSQDAGPPRDGAQAVAAYVDAAAALRGLTISPDYRGAVIANLQQILAQSAPLMSLDLDWAEEAAPVFRA